MQKLLVAGADPTLKDAVRNLSFVDSAANPEMYVIQESAQASPAYKVHFR